MEQEFKITFTVNRATGTGVSLYAEMDDEHYDSEEWDDSPPGSLSDDWFDLLQVLYKLPKAVEAAGLSWSNAEVGPVGLYPAPGHTKDGIVVRWTWTEPSRDEDRYEKAWRREIAMEAGMGLGVDAYNEVMGCDVDDDE